MPNVYLYFYFFLLRKGGFDRTPRTPPIYGPDRINLFNQYSSDQWILILSFSILCRLWPGSHLLTWALGKCPVNKRFIIVQWMFEICSNPVVIGFCCMIHWWSIDECSISYRLDMHCHSTYWPFVSLYRKNNYLSVDLIFIILSSYVWLTYYIQIKYPAFIIHVYVYTSAITSGFLGYRWHRRLVQREPRRRSSVARHLSSE